MPIQFRNGKILFTDAGKIAMHPDCCCLDCSDPCAVGCGNSATPPSELIVTIADIPAGYSCCNDPDGEDCNGFKSWHNLDSLNGTYVFSKRSGNTPYSGAPGGDFCWLERTKVIGSGIQWKYDGGTPDVVIDATATLYLGGTDSNEADDFPHLFNDCTALPKGLSLYLHVLGDEAWFASGNRPQGFHRSTHIMQPPDPSCEFVLDTKEHRMVADEGTDEWCAFEDYTFFLAEATITLEQA